MSTKEAQQPQNEASESDRLCLEAECQALRNKLDSLRKRRRHVQSLLEKDISNQLSQWKERCNQASRRRSEALVEYHSAVSMQRQTQHRLDLAQTWNVTNDCFYIWHRGPFGIINGLRLGSEVPALPRAEPSSEGDATATTTANGSSMGKMELLGYSLGLSGGEGTSSPTTNETITVPWSEINSALGLVALLLSTLEVKPHSNFHFKNEIVAMGSTSKIGLRRGDAVTYYDLFTDDTFHFFGKRNFNIALTGLVRCVAEAEETVQERDRTIALPHAIDASPRGEMTIGGLPVAYGPDGDQWTRAMKYLLTDLKWLVAYATKHIDR